MGQGRRAVLEWPAGPRARVVLLVHAGSWSFPPLLLRSITWSARTCIYAACVTGAMAWHPIVLIYLPRSGDVGESKIGVKRVM